MTRDANDLAQDYERRSRYEPVNAAKPGATPRWGRLIGVWSPNDQVSGEHMIAEHCTVQPVNEHYLLVNTDDGHTYYVNTNKYFYLEFWVRDDEGE